MEIFIIGWIILLAAIVLFGWLGGWIGRKVGIPRWLGVIIGVGILVAIFFLMPELLVLLLSGYIAV